MQEALASAQQPTPLVTIEPNISECPQHRALRPVLSSGRLLRVKVQSIS